MGGRGSSSGNVIKIKNDTFKTATYNYDENKRHDIEVKGVSFKYKSVSVGIFNSKQESYSNNNPYYNGRGTENFIAVVRTNNETNGTMLTKAKTQKEAVYNAMKLIDEKREQILKAIGKK